jgi:hypothetical protein
MTITKIKLENNVASRSGFADVQETSLSLSGTKLGNKTSLGLGRSSFAADESRKLLLSPNPSRFRGTWTGLLTQPDKTWNYEMNLRRVGKSRFTGTSTVADPIDPSIFGVMSLTGRIVYGALLFRETQITDQNPSPGTRWCIKGGRLQISVSNNGVFLRGPWSDPTCNSGQIELQKRSV